MNKRGSTFQGGKEVGIDDPNEHTDASNTARRVNAAQLARRKIAEPRKRSRANSPSLPSFGSNPDAPPTFAPSFQTSQSESPAPGFSLAFGGTANANTSFNFNLGGNSNAAPAFNSNPFAGQAAAREEAERQRILEQNRKEEEWLRQNPPGEDKTVYSPGIPQSEVEKYEKEGWAWKVQGTKGVWYRKDGSDGTLSGPNATPNAGALVPAASTATAATVGGGDEMETSPDVGAKMPAPGTTSQNVNTAPVTKNLFGAPSNNGPSLFGAPASQQPQPSQPTFTGFGNTGLFGNPAANKPIESQSFAGTPNSQPQQSSQQPEAGQAPSSTSASFTFGSTSTSTPSLFGAQNASTSFNTGTSGTASTPMSFGSQQQTPAFGGFGQSQQSQGQQKPLFNLDTSRSIFSSFGQNNNDNKSDNTASQTQEPKQSTTSGFTSVGETPVFGSNMSQNVFGSFSKGNDAAAAAESKDAEKPATTASATAAAPTLFGSDQSKPVFNPFAATSEKPAETSKPSTSTGLFGASTSTPAFGQSGFGSSSTATKPLFGAPSSESVKETEKGSEATSAPAPTPAKPLFGAPASAPAPAPSQSLFGAPASTPAKPLFGAAVPAPAKEAEKPQKEKDDEPLFVPMSDNNDKEKKAAAPPVKKPLFGASVGAGFGAKLGEKKDDGKEKEKEEQNVMGPPENRIKAAKKGKFTPRTWGPTLAVSDKTVEDPVGFDRTWRLRALNEAFKRKISAIDVETHTIDAVLEFYLRNRKAIGCPLGYTSKTSTKRKRAREETKESGDAETNKRTKAIEQPEPTQTNKPAPSKKVDSIPSSPPFQSSNTANLFASSYHGHPEPATSSVPSSPEQRTPEGTSPVNDLESSPKTAPDDDSQVRSLGTVSSSPDAPKRSLYERSEIIKTQGADDEKNDEDASPAKRARSESKEASPAEGSTTPTKPVPANPFSGGAATAFGSNNTSGSAVPSLFGSASNKPPTTLFSFGGDNKSSSDAPKEDSTATKPSAPLFGSASTTGFSFGQSTPTFGSTFGQPTSGSIFATAASAPKPSEAEKKPSTPAGDGDDEDKTDDPQVDLLRPKPADNEEVVCELRAQLLKLVSGEGWKVQGIGLARVMRNKETKKAYLVHRLDPSGRVLLNSALSPKLNYKLNVKNITFLVPVEGASPENYMLRAGKNGEKDAENMAKNLEECKMA